MAKAANNWIDANQRYLTAALSIVREKLVSHASGAEPTTAAESASHAALEAASRAMPAPAALEHLSAAFHLSIFERELLLLCVGMEVDPSFPQLCAAASHDTRYCYPTFSLAFSTLSDPHWTAMFATSPLRKMFLMELAATTPMALAALSLSEYALEFLMTGDSSDQRLTGVVESRQRQADLVPSHRRLSERIASAWRECTHSEALPVVVLCANNAADRAAIAIAAAGAIGLRLSSVRARNLPQNHRELDSFIRLWEREARLRGSVLYLDKSGLAEDGAVTEWTIARVIESVNALLIVGCDEWLGTGNRATIVMRVPKPSTEEKLQEWQRALGPAAASVNGTAEALAAQFSLGMDDIQGAIRQAMAIGEAKGKPTSDGVTATEAQGADAVDKNDLGARLWEACRMLARPRLADLAKRIDAVASWEDLVLPEPQIKVLRQIAVHIRNRGKVYEDWGFNLKGTRSLGISALFSGASGTGKTMAAEVLANELRLDLYRIDLSAVVSKYVGETEKNLRRIFDTADEGGAILLFDEADALFGKRSEVKDSHDRYANIEISYLLQRMEEYRGLALLTTNMKNAIDVAFLRRIRFVVQFPFPDAAQRQQIWSHVFPSRTPTEGLDFASLSRLNVTGGNIRNIALNGTFLAADAGEPVGMTHLLDAAQAEYAKLEKPLTEVEVKGWNR